MFTHYGRTDDLENDPNAGRKETRHFDNMSQLEAGYEAIIEEKTGKKGYRKVDMVSGNIGSEKARARHALASPSTSSSQSAHDQTTTSSPDQSALHSMVRRLVEYIYSEAASRLTATVSAKVSIGTSKY